FFSLGTANVASMGGEGFEPSHLAVPDPKSGASTSFATRPAWSDTLTNCGRPAQQDVGGSRDAAPWRGASRIESEGNESGRNRTFNLWIKSPLLCQLSYAPVAFKARACTQTAHGVSTIPRPWGFSHRTACERHGRAGLLALRSQVWRN